jgi:hypothetical protein
MPRLILEGTATPVSSSGPRNLSEFAKMGQCGFVGPMLFAGFGVTDLTRREGPRMIECLSLRLKRVFSMSNILLPITVAVARIIGVGIIIGQPDPARH